MEVLTAEHMGFCYGVRRAVELAAAAPGQAGAPAVTLGPLIHNPQMIARLQAQGVGVVNELAEAGAATVVIRSHGVGPSIYEEAERQGRRVLDATCPHVKKAQQAARAFAEQGLQVVVAGERKHPEVASILEWAGPGAIAAESAADIESAALSGAVGIVSQTTLEKEVFDGILAALRQRGIEPAINPTICQATAERQQAALRLARQVDVMVVVGGRNSSNTQKLLETCRLRCERSVLVETPEDVPPDLAEADDRVALTAGASTPQWLLEQVRARIEENAKTR